MSILRTVRRPTLEQFEDGPASLHLVTTELAQPGLPARARAAGSGRCCAAALGPRGRADGHGGDGLVSLQQDDGQAGDALGPTQRAQPLGPGRLDRDGGADHGGQPGSMASVWGASRGASATTVHPR